MDDPVASLFMLLWIFALGLILYHLVKSCFGSRSGPNPRPTPRPPRAPDSGWFSSGTPHHDSNDPPPPYTKYPSSSPTGGADAAGWRPGFWTGAAVGGLGAMLMNRNRQQEREFLRSPGMYDWEAERMFRPARPAPASSSWFGGSSSGPRRRPVFDDNDRGEGPSDLGRMRRSTGLGGSNVR